VASSATDVGAMVASNPLWYHTMEVAPGLTTAGWFDLRPVVNTLPWPDVRGKRCLDIGTFDGFLAFEMERRGAAEIVCTDVASHADWDHLPRQRAEAVAFWEARGGEKGAGFRIAAEILGSNARREWINIYDRRLSGSAPSTWWCAGRSCCTSEHRSWHSRQ
jgi:tRNA (mo5U34)-methyltransferase